jgi:hypothetical protein
MAEIVLEPDANSATVSDKFKLEMNLKHRGRGLNDRREATLSDRKVEVQDSGPLGGMGPAKRGVVGDLPDNIRYRFLLSFFPASSHLRLRLRPRTRSCTMFNRCDAVTDFAPSTLQETSKSKTQMTAPSNST